MCKGNNKDSWEGYEIVALRKGNYTRTFPRCAKLDREINRHMARYSVSKDSLDHNLHELLTTINCVHDGSEYPQVVNPRILGRVRTAFDHLVKKGIISVSKDGKNATATWPQGVRKAWLAASWDGDVTDGTGPEGDVESAAAEIASSEASYQPTVSSISTGTEMSGASTQRASARLSLASSRWAPSESCGSISPWSSVTNKCHSTPPTTPNSLPRNDFNPSISSACTSRKADEPHASSLSSTMGVGISSIHAGSQGQDPTVSSVRSARQGFDPILSSVGSKSPGMHTRSVFSHNLPTPPVTPEKNQRTFRHEDVNGVRLPETFFQQKSVPHTKTTAETNVQNPARATVSEDQKWDRIFELNHRQASASDSTDVSDSRIEQYLAEMLICDEQGLDENPDRSEHPARPEDPGCETTTAQNPAVKTTEETRGKQTGTVTAAAASLRQSQLRLAQTRHDLTLSFLKTVRLALGDSSVPHKRKVFLIAQLCKHVRDGPPQCDGQRGKLDALQDEVEQAEGRLAKLVA